MPIVVLTPHSRDLEIELRGTKFWVPHDYDALSEALSGEGIEPIRTSDLGVAGWCVAIGYDSEVGSMRAMKILAAILIRAGFRPAVLRDGEVHLI